MFSLSELQKACRSLSPYLYKTPLIRARSLEVELNLPYRLFLKCEHLQITGSFKARGALYACLKEKKGIATRSSGNFALAVAMAAQKFSLPAHIVLSDKISSYKKTKIQSYPINIYFSNTRKKEEELAASLAKKKHLELLSPFDHPLVLKGQASLALEVFSQLPSIKYFIGPIGGGGLMGAGALALKKIKPSVVTIGAEPEGANDYFLSRERKEKVKLDRAETFCEGLQAPTVGEMTYSLLEKYVDDVLVVSDKNIKALLCQLYDLCGIVIEPSGACSLAACLNAKTTFHGDVVCVLSGGNICKQEFMHLIGKYERD